MMICTAGYLFYGSAILGYNTQKTTIILFICMINVVESFENIIRAQLQYKGFLYIGAIMFIIRWISIFITFGIALYLTKNTGFALGMSLLTSLLVFILCYFSFRKYMQIPIVDETPSKNCAELLRACFPLFITMFLSFYIVNSPKYALDRFMDASAQACFGFISMPVFAIQLMNELIYQPQLVYLTAEYNEGSIFQFRKHVIRQYLIILMLTAASLTVAYFIGIPFLSFLYNTNLEDYLTELLILLLGGGFLALSGYQGSILTLIRRQKYQLYGYIPVSVMALLFVGYIVKKHGTIGAALSYLVLIVILCLLYEVFIRCSLKNHLKSTDDSYIYPQP